VLRPQGRFLYADHRTRRKVPRLKRLARAAGLDGQLRDITAYVVSACECDVERRRGIIQSNLPWHYRWLVGARIERYSGLPGTATFESFHSGDGMYFLTCMMPREHCADNRR